MLNFQNVYYNYITLLSMLHFLKPSSLRQEDFLQFSIIKIFPPIFFFIFRQDSHLISQVTNNNTPALVAQALSGKLFGNRGNFKKQKMQNIQKWPILIYISFISARKRRVQLFQKVHPLHNSWSNENLQCKCQYMAKG